MTAPKLRFKEFSGNWETSPLKALCKINQGLQIAIENRFLEDGENRFFYITNEFLKEGSKKNYFIENPPKSVICDESDILMTRTGNTGQVVTDVKGAFHNNFFKIDFDRSIINRNFFIEFLKKDTTQHLILKYAGASTIPDLNHSDFYRIVMPITTIEEQTKIATFLSAVDEKISQLSQKLHLLGQYKQGMMQKLFSQQIRFKVDDGSEFGEWKSIQLKDIAERITRKNKEENQNALTISAQMGLVNQQEYFSKQIASRDLSKYYLLHKGEYAYNKSYSAGYPMGAIKRLKLYDKGVVSTLYICFSLNKHINSDFFEQYVESGALVPELEKIAQEGARNHGLLNISLQEFFEVNLWTPCLEEQTKIANFLSSIDKKIDVISEQLEQAKLWKKGLLQQMFV
ncbi:3-mercaptopyruvate sulfurtransferase [Acinetobacter towneri]|uniref:3-mercaptopyruvate sulfurtransferase n=1 Tax=Acinetobacter towneri TaxID=202956 RepID=A0A1E8DZB1_9GAMM|nr:restriction endonuclease subunit S [Acinetobacter towneri]OFE42751.1 3-mercaptopyruvate sulfurtransferase [Acinetobacter towneri]